MQRSAINTSAANCKEDTRHHARPRHATPSDDHPPFAGLASPAAYRTEMKGHDTCSPLKALPICNAWKAQRYNKAPSGRLPRPHSHSARHAARIPNQSQDGNPIRGCRPRQEPLLLSEHSSIHPRHANPSQLTDIVPPPQRVSSTERKSKAPTGSHRYLNLTCASQPNMSTNSRTYRTICRSQDGMRHICKYCE